MSAHVLLNLKTSWRISIKCEACQAFYHFFRNKFRGAQWLSGRVLDSRLKGRGFEPHWRHCVVVFEQDTFILA